LYTYSLKQGIEDGFLAPYKVIRLALNIDTEGWRPEKGKTDKQGVLVDDRIYNSKDYDRLLVIDERTQLVAKQVMTFLRQTNVYDKTIIFCTDIEHATRMRQAIVNEAQDLVLENYKYVMKITGDDIEGKRELDNFINPEERYPVIATTSKLMTTGVDAQTCKLIVLDANIGSMTEFKQIIGRGTRVNESFGKQFFTIMDFRNVTDKFANKEFDGEPVMIKVIEGVNTDTETNFTDENTSTESQSDTNEDGITDNDVTTTPVIISGGDINEKTQTKIYVAGVEVKLLSERIQYLDDNGKLITGGLTDYTRSGLLKEFSTLDNFLTRWNSIDKKKALIDEIEQQGIILEVLRNDVKKDLDIFDLICHIAWDKPALTRTERANNVKKRDYFTKYSNQAQEVLQALLDKYADVGIEHIENMSILSVDPFSAIGTPIEIIKLFGGKENYMAALKQLETEIYSIEA
jgi:type I restriction enzyme R subunit